MQVLAVIAHEESRRIVVFGYLVDYGLIVTHLVDDNVTLLAVKRFRYR
jgi:hypothetical protein